MKKQKIDWKDTQEAQETYRCMRVGVQVLANQFQCDYGLQANELFKTFSYFMLPNPEFRSGRELTCEVISPEKSVK